MTFSRIRGTVYLLQLFHSAFLVLPCTEAFQPKYHSDWLTGHYVFSRLDMAPSNSHNKEPGTNPKEKQEQQLELLQELNQNFDYEGRVNAKKSYDVSTFRSGYVSVIGAPNMGKSTLVNALLKEPLCIATRRPQTTRHAILGILTTEDCQLCLMDTPGIMDAPAYKLQEGMMEAVQGALKDADVLLVVTDLFSTPIPNDDLFARVQQQQGFRPIVVIINKVDLMGKVNAKKVVKARKEDNREEEEDAIQKTVTVEEAVARWRQLLPQALAVLPVSAEDGPDNLGVVALRKLLVGGPDLPAAIRDLGRPLPGMFKQGVAFLEDEEAQELLPRGPPLYDEEMYTDRSERFLASEMIRAALLETFQKELPYCCEVRVMAFKEEPKGSPDPKIIRIDANIFVERDSQKAIVIGKQGAKIKEVGIVARQSLEDFFQTKIFLQLQVKVDKDWRKKDDKLKKFGYLK